MCIQNATTRDRATDTCTPIRLWTSCALQSWAIHSLLLTNNMIESIPITIESKMNEGDCVEDDDVLRHS